MSPGPVRPSVRIPLFSGGWLKYLLLAGAGLIISTVLYNTVTTYVGPGEFAIRQVYVGTNPGNRNEVVGTGLHFLIPGYERLHVFPKQLLLLEFNDDKLQASAEAAYAPSISIQTSEGYRVTVDVSVVFRIVDPFKVISAVGPGLAYESALVRPRADTVLRQTLGQLDAEQFYQGNLRRQKAYEARDLLETELAPAGIQVWAVLVRHYSYDERYQGAIENRKIQDQTVFKNRAEAAAAIEEAEKNRVLAAGQAIVDVEKERGAAEVRKINADAELYSRKRNADGDLLVALAEAESSRLENEALSAAGASNVVGLKMAQAISNTQLIVVSTDGPGGVNPLKLDQLVEGW